MLRFSAPIPLALYVHIPWCIRKCPYCDFNSHEARTPLPERSYVAALLADLEQDLPRIENHPLESVFIGGGTPSLFSAEAISELLAGLRARLRLRADTEITLEANPGTVELGKLGEFRDAGVNRLSIGIQSFNSSHLQRLGRIHDRKEAVRAAEHAYSAGFDNFNLDLMFGLPEQSLEQAVADVDTAIALGPSHISHYQLTLEPNTFFYRHPPELPDNDLLWSMQERCQERLANNGYAQYEVSAYARHGRRCQHNLNYWKFGDYFGIGAGAHGKLTDWVNGSITRLWKLKNPRDYLKHAGTERIIGGSGEIPPQDLRLEFMLNALRLMEGFSGKLWTERTGLCLEDLGPGLHQAEKRGLLSWNGDHIRPTELGWRFLNDLLELFLPEE